ncbi:NUMOD3 domain-containing DNA-binding protein [Burkholderia cenocepacia]|nr:NUMOD3 domain-containing DNA-binding protein [Burkholderia cenocepacia]
MEPTNNDKRKYNVQKAGAKRRKDKNGNPIEFKLTFDEWWSFWQESGHYDERGVGKGKYVMARIDDIGPYELGNIYCCTNTENNSMAKKGCSLTQETKNKMSAAHKGRKRTFSEEHRNRLSAAKKGKKFTQEHRNNISAA